MYHKSQKLLVPVDIKKDPLYCTLDSTQSSPLGQKVSEWACWAKIINLGRILLLRMLLALEKMAFVSPWRSQFRCCEKYMYFWWSLLPTLCFFVASIKKWTIQNISYHFLMRNNYKINSKLSNVYSWKHWELLLGLPEKNVLLLYEDKTTYVAENHFLVTRGPWVGWQKISFEMNNAKEFHA